MKKTILATALSCACPLIFTSAANAVPLIDVKFATGTWSVSANGDVGSTDTSIEELGLDDDNAIFYSIAFEHPVPVIPNVRLKRTNLTLDGTGTLEEDFILDGEVFSAESAITSNIDLSHTDLTLYYGLPEFFLDVDFGLTLRQYQGEFSATTELEQEVVDIDAIIPMVFADVRFDLPLTGLYLGAEANVLSVGDSSLSDYNARIGYSTDVIPFLADLDIEVGYREMSLTAEDDFDADVKIDGAYAQIMLAF